MNLFGLYWEDPWFFLALLALPLLLWRLVALGRPGRVPMSSDHWLGALRSSGLAKLWWVPGSLRILAVGALVIALARPQTVDSRVVDAEGVDIMLALDMSASMNAVDMGHAELEKTLEAGKVPKNRFEAARDILQRFVASRRQDRIGLVVFGPEAWLKYPLTLDYSRLVRTLEELVLDIGLADRRTGECLNGCTISGRGTAIGDALGRAFNRLRRSDAKTKLILLITDGKQEAGTLDPLAIARHIRDLPDNERVRVYTFLVGSEKDTWVPQLDFGGTIVTDSAGLPVYHRPGNPFPTDPELLRKIAEMTGGKFYESYNEEKFREDVADLERTVFESKIHVNRSDVFMPLVYIGMVLLLLEWLLRFTRFRRVV